MKLCSFDIFDTSLVRICGAPSNVFFLTGVRLFGNNESLIKEYVNYRSAAERMVKSVTCKSNVSLSDIIGIFDDNYISRIGVSKKELEIIEKEIEYNNLVPVKETSDLIENYREKGYTIAFISDMYLPSDFIRSVLSKSHLIKEIDYLFVSIDYNANKYDGTLYDVIYDDLKPKEWIHFGDNLHSDVKMARLKNVSANHLSYKYTNDEIEWIIKKETNFYLLYEEIVAGLIRAARLQFQNNTFSIIAADIVAMNYVPFVNWLINDAIGRNIDCLYFLSRDSLIFYRIAQSLNRPEIEYRYLHLSRKSIYLPYLISGEISSYLDCIETFEGYTPKRIFDTFSIPSDFYLKYLQKVGLSELDILDQINLSKFISVLEDISFKCYVINIANKARKNLLGYLQQEKVIGLNSNSALVDLGWLGTTRKILNKILEEDSFEQIYMYYWGVLSNRLSSIYGMYSSYVYLEDYPICKKNILVMEHYFSCNSEGSTLGYEKKDGFYIPVLSDVENSDFKIILQEMNNDISVKVASFVSLYDEEILNILFDVMKRKGLETLIRMRLYPSYNEAKCFSNVIVGDSIKGESVVVQKLSLINALLVLFIGYMRNRRCWPEASIIYTFNFRPFLYMYHCVRDNMQMIRILIKKFLNYGIGNR